MKPTFSRDDFELLCRKEIACQVDYLTITDSSDIFSDISDIHSNCESADLQNINSSLLFGDLKNGDLWDIGLKIGSNFLSNSFLCASKKNFGGSNGGMGGEDNNKISIIPGNQFDQNGLAWLEKMKVWSKDGKELTTKEITQNLTKEFLQSKLFEKTKSSKPALKDSNKVVDLDDEPDSPSTKLDSKNSKDSKDSKEEKKLPNKKAFRRKKRRNLCIREDVMNKNVLRALKRELITLYEAYDGSSIIGSFREKVRDFSEHLLMTSNFDPYQNKHFNKTDFSNIIAILLNYCRMKKLVRTPEEREQLRMCYEVIYSYSHQKFNDFLALPEVTAIIKIISESGIDKIIEHNETLGGDHYNKYKTHIIELLDRL